MASELAKQLFVRIGKSVMPMQSLEQASRAYVSTIEHLGLGGSQTPQARIYDDGGKVVGYISYNGRVWAGDPCDWKPTDAPLFDPRMVA